MRMRALATALALTLFMVGAAAAQVPFFGVYFNEGNSIEALPPPPCGNPCPGFGVPGYLWISLVNANAFVTGVEFAVSYPPEMTWLADQNTQPVTVGNTPSGFSIGWALPQNGFFNIPVCKVLFLWNCDRCLRANIPIVVVSHPVTGALGYTDFPTYTYHTAVGLTSLVCACVPVEDTTWGQVKSLYDK
jgi:hypothetical protein